MARDFNRHRFPVFAVDANALSCKNRMDRISEVTAPEQKQLILISRTQCYKWGKKKNEINTRILFTRLSFAAIFKTANALCFERYDFFFELGIFHEIQLIYTITDEIIQRETLFLNQINMNPVINNKVQSLRESNFTFPSTSHEFVTTASLLTIRI